MIRYGILGFGHHAAKRLMPAFRGASGSKLEGMWRRDAAKAAVNARDFSIPRVFSSAEALCAAPEIDAVFVASPDALHLEHVLLALGHGKPVLCEKPLAMSAAEVERMLAAASAAGAPLGVAQNFRYDRSVELARSWIAEGRIGKPAVAHAQFCYQTARSPRVWINDPKLALGGPIGDVGVHCIDALRFLTGDEIASVATVALQDARSGEVEAKASLALGFASGAIGAVMVNARAAYRTLFEIAGEDGLISSEFGFTVDRPVDVILRHDGVVVESVRVSNADAYSRMLDGFSAWVRGEGAYAAPAADGLHNQRALDAAYASWRTGRRELVR